MQSHHYLGALPKIGNTLWYVALFEGEWVACISFSAAALKCAVRDKWIGWTFRHQFDRLNLVANNLRQAQITLSDPAALSPQKPGISSPLTQGLLSMGFRLGLEQQIFPIKNLSSVFFVLFLKKWGE